MVRNGAFSHTEFIGSDAANIIAEFFYKPVQDRHASDQAGHPIFTDVEFVKLYIGGDSKTVVERKVKDLDRQRFAGQYRQFLESREQRQEGTPLSEWPPVTAAQVKNFAAQNVQTVEQLAALPDGIVAKLGPGMRALQRKAQGYIDRQKDETVVEKYASENATLRAQVEELNGQFQALQAEIDGEADGGTSEAPSGGSGNGGNGGSGNGGNGGGRSGKR